MLLGPHDAITHISRSVNENKKEQQEEEPAKPKKGETEKVTDRQKFEIKPYYLLLMIYGVIAMIGIIFNSCN